MALGVALLFGVIAPTALGSLGLDSALGAGGAGSCTTGYNTAEVCSTATSSAGSIQGTVTNGSDTPLAGICVHIYPGGGNLTNTNDAATASDGTFTIGDLPAGAYDVEFTVGCPNTQNLAPVWYGGTSTEAASTPVTVVVGQYTSDVNVVMSAAGATISGTVTNTSSATLGGVCVSAYPPGYPYEPIGTATTASNGTYSLAGLPPGNDDVEFDPTCGDTEAAAYATGYYATTGTTGDLSSATALDVTAGATFSSIDGQLTSEVELSFGTGTISGTVSGLVLADPSVCVELYVAGSTVSNTDEVGGSQEVSAGSDTYEFTDLGKGDYDVLFDPTCGFFDGTEPSYGLQWYSDKATPATATAVDVTSSTDAVTGIDATMSTASGTISGTVDDGSGAATGVCVNVYATGTSVQIEDTSTSGGSYSVGVPAGSYNILLTDDCPGTGNNDGYQWYTGSAGGSTTQAGAAPIVVSSGGTATANATLVEGGTISGSVTVPAGVNVSVAVYPVGSGEEVGSADGSPTSPSTYQVGGLAPGDYDVEFIATTEDFGGAFEWYAGSTSSLEQASAHTVSVTAGGTTDSIDGTFGDISGTVTQPDSDSDTIGVFLYQHGTSNEVEFADASSGTYDFGVVPDASFDVEFLDESGSLQSQWYDDAAEQSAATAVDVTGSSTVTGINASLTAFSESGGAIGGSITGAGGTPAFDVCVDVYPPGSPTDVVGSAQSFPTSSADDYLAQFVPNGSYDVEFDPTCDGQFAPGYPVQYYDSGAPGDTTTVAADATPVTIAGDDTVSGINDQLPAVTPPPTVSAVSPDSGPTSGGTSVTITGTNLSGATAVSFGGTAAGGYTVNSSTQITATSPSHAAGTVDVTVATTNGTSGTGTADEFTFVPPSAYSAVTPYRICDTRGTNGLSGTDAQCAGDALSAGGSLSIQVAGTNPTGTSSGGVPASGVTAVVLNVTVTGESSQGYLTVWPGGARPTASSLNYRANKTVANLVTVALSSTGEVSFYSLQGTNLIVDVEGYYAAPSGTAGLFNSVTPYRICDTRGAGGLSGTDAQCAGHTLAGGTPLSIQVTGTNPTGTSSGGVPSSGVSAVVLNVTAIGHGTGYVTAYPQGVSAPTASNLNFSSGQVVPNRVIVPVSASGQISLLSNTSVDAIVDVNGWFTDGSSDTQTGAVFVATSPSRICDTRSNGNTTPCAGETITTRTPLVIAVAGQGPVPSSGVVAVVANITVADTTAQSYLTAWPTGQTQPTASDLNWVAGLAVPNMAVVGLGTSGDISVYVAGGSADVIVDVTGWYVDEA